MLFMLNRWTRLYQPQSSTGAFSFPKKGIHMSNDNVALLSQRLITPLEEKKDVILLIQEGRIEAVGSRENIKIPENFKKIDVGDRIIAPGFIDIHNHGGLGMMVAFDGRKAVVDNAKRLVETGCTGWLPTVNTLESLPDIVSCIEENVIGTEILGIHMEGPLFVSVAAVISGGLFGDHCSPISDTTILASMGSACDHIDHFKTQLPYAMIVAIISGLLFLMCGFTSSVIIVIPGIALLFFLIIFFHRIKI